MKKEAVIDLWTVVSRGLRDSVKNEILVPSGRGGKYNVRDYVSACCYVGEFLKANPGVVLDGIGSKAEMDRMIPRFAMYRMHYYTPCLALRYDELKDVEKAECFDDRKWVATQKMNGVRGWLCISKDAVVLYSRNYSDVDCTLLEYWGNIDQELDRSGYSGCVCVDVEIVFDPGVDLSSELDELGLETDSPLDAMVALLHSDVEKALRVQRVYKEKYGKDLVSFKMIAPLWYKGINYIDCVLGAGMDIYDEVLGYVKGLGINIGGIARCSGNRIEKENFLESVLAIGGEGVVFHNRDGVYCTSENRSKTSYIKLKRSVSATKDGIGMGDTIDGFVSGFKLGGVGTVNEGLVTTLEFSIWLNDAGGMVKKFIGAVSGLEMGIKRELTIDGSYGMYTQSYIGSDGKEHIVSLNPEWDGVVAELSGQALSSVNCRLEHPVLVRWRKERDMNSCIYTKEWLMSQTTNNGIKYRSL